MTVTISDILATNLKNILFQIAYVHRPPIGVVANTNMEGFRGSGPFNYVAQSKFLGHRRAVNVLWIRRPTEPVGAKGGDITVHQFLSPVRFSLIPSPKFEHLSTQALD